MMMLLILTSILGYELKTAVGTSVFIMSFTALTGAASHFMIGGMPDWPVFFLCVIFTLLWARIAAVFANKAKPGNIEPCYRRSAGYPGYHRHGIPDAGMIP